MRGGVASSFRFGDLFEVVDPGGAHQLVIVDDRDSANLVELHVGQGVGEELVDVEAERVRGVAFARGELCRGTTRGDRDDDDVGVGQHSAERPVVDHEDLAGVPGAHQPGRVRERTTGGQGPWCRCHHVPDSLRHVVLTLLRRPASSHRVPDCGRLIPDSRLDCAATVPPVCAGCDEAPTCARVSSQRSSSGRAKLVIWQDSTQPFQPRSCP
jgi:hypothetical protein